MGKNREGYGTAMPDALEDARGQKGKEAAMRRKQSGLPLTRGNHDDVERELQVINSDSLARPSSPTKGTRRKSESKPGVTERVRLPGEIAPVSGNLQTIFHGQYGGQWANGRR
jgi:hypothetical protein